MDNNEILLKAIQKENEVLKENLAKCRSEKENLAQDNIKIREQLDSILYSRSYKIIQKIVRIFKKNK